MFIKLTPSTSCHSPRTTWMRAYPCKNTVPFLLYKNKAKIAVKQFYECFMKLTPVPCAFRPVQLEREHANVDAEAHGRGCPTGLHDPRHLRQGGVSTTNKH